MACGVQHMHAYGECGWTRWIGSYFSLKKIEVGEASSGQVVRSVRTHFGSSCLHLDASEPRHIAWLTDLTLKVYLHDSETTLSWIFLHVLTLSGVYLSPPLPCPSYTDSLSLFLLIHFALHTFFSRFLLWPFFGCCFIQTLSCFFMKRKGLIHSCISSTFPIINNVTITGFQYKTNIFVSLLVLIVMLQLKRLYES